MSSAVIAKPAMRGLLAKCLWFHPAVAFTLVFSIAGTLKFVVGDPRKTAYADIYKKYDAKKDAGVFESVKLKK